MRAAIAVRVSPRPAENVRYSPEIQEQKCRDWCEREGHTVVTVVRDILVSGGSAKRFESIFAAIDEHHPDLFVVSDLSRWTRDTPTRFWAVKALLEDQGVKLVSVDEPWLGSEMPFGDTVTTAQVEMNLMERRRINAKTSEGVRKAWAAGKRWGKPFGWTFDQETRKWSQDVALITAFYTDWVSGVSGYVMAHRYGMFETNVRTAIGAECQRDIIGHELWDRAQERRVTGARRDSIRSSIYRGLLVCPFCGGSLQHATHWGHYKCGRHHLAPHDWWSLSARRYVTPKVREVLQRLREPERPPTGLVGAVRPRQRDWSKELDRLSIAWSQGRLSTERYEAAVKQIEQERADRKVDVPVVVTRQHLRDLSVIDLEDRDPDTGNDANRLLRGIIERIDIAPDRTATVILKPGLEGWVHPDR